MCIVIRVYGVTGASVNNGPWVVKFLECPKVKVEFADKAAEWGQETLSSSCVDAELFTVTTQKQWRPLKSSQSPAQPLRARFVQPQHYPNQILHHGQKPRIWGPGGLANVSPK